MALDGITIAAIRAELNDVLADGRISKIAQPETDELLLTVKTKNGQRRLLLSANASLPLCYLTDESKKSPMTAPNFCMLLRKYIAGGRILSVEQPQMERVLFFYIEHLDEMGDLCEKKLIIELMGKHSNIIFCDDSDRIIDSIKHISAQTSSVREVLPGRPYFIPAQEGKLNPMEAEADAFADRIRSCPQPAGKAVYTSYTGIAPLTATEICYRAGIDADAPCASLTDAQLLQLADVFIAYMTDVRGEQFQPSIVIEDGRPVEFSAFPLTCYADREHEQESFDSISEVLQSYYARRNAYTRIHQKSADLRHIVTTLLERARKKYALQQKQMQSTEKRDKYRKYGELIHVYGYQVPEGSAGFEAQDYETGQTIQIPLDKTLTPMENAEKYFARYAKLKRTFEALTVQIEDTKQEIDHLESVLTSLDLADDESDLAQIRRELADSGYIKSHRTGKKKNSRPEKSRPYHYRSSDGYDIYIGKNNYQNDELTFKMARGNDWWFHAKGMPGSHVIVLCPDGEMPDRTFEEAAALAAWYSRGRGSDKVDVDYLQKKNVKKPNKAKPGFVVYYTNYSMTITPKLCGTELTD